MKEWALTHWVTTSILVWWGMLFATGGIVQIVNLVGFKLPNRILRSRNIRAHGWPPPHLDADGDFKELEEKSKHNDHRTHDKAALVPGRRSYPL